MFFKKNKFKNLTKLTMNDYIEINLLKYQVPIGSTITVRQLAKWISEKGRFTSGTVIEELEELVSQFVKRDMKEKFFISTHKELIKKGALPNFNNDLALYFSESRYLHVIIRKRIEALILDKFLEEHPDLANMSCLKFLTFIGEKTNVCFEHTKKENDFYLNKVLLNEMINFSRELDLMFENSNISTRVEFKNDYDHNNQFKSPHTFGFIYDKNLSFFENFKILTKNSEEVIESLEQSQLKLFSCNSMRDNYKVSNLQIDFNKIDPVFIPILSEESLEGYRCALYTNKYWDNFKIDIMLIENEAFLNNEEKEKILIEIDNSLVII